MMHRRELLRGLWGCTCCAATSVVPAAPSWAGQFRPRTGCVVRGSEATRALGSGILAAHQSGLPSLVEGRSRTTGDAALNRKLDKALLRLAKTFDVWPQVGFYDDGDQPNAIAISFPKDGRQHYAVVFGKNYFRRMFAYDPSGVTFLQTAAHEFAHVWMFKSGRLDELLSNQPTVRRAELHADFMSGYYLGLRKLDHPDISFRAAGLKRWESGDILHQDPHHHGTPAQRLEAAEVGFLLAYRERATVTEAFSAATTFVLRH